VEVPYFIDRPMKMASIEEEMRRADARASQLDMADHARQLRWKYNQNVAISGFTANEALALKWNLFPAVVFDLEIVDSANRLELRSEGIPYRRFEDLYVFTSMNAYNRRCGWHHYYSTLPRRQVIANADFVILRSVDEFELESHYPDHDPVARVEQHRDAIVLLRNRRNTTPYRSLYARRFLERNRALPAEELRLVALELLMSRVLAGYEGSLDALTREFPILLDGQSPARNIYWFGGYGPVIELADRLIQRQSQAARPPSSRD
jgi:hypothetical protein